MESFFAWELVYPIATLVLLIAMIYAGVQYARRNKANDRTADGSCGTAMSIPRNGTSDIQGKSCVITFAH
jgi:hypothetical protein